MSLAPTGALPLDSAGGLPEVPPPPTKILDPPLVPLMHRIARQNAPIQSTRDVIENVTVGLPAKHWLVLRGTKLIGDGRSALQSSSTSRDETVDAVKYLRSSVFSTRSLTSTRRLL